MVRFGLLGVLCALAGCPAGDDSTDDYPIAPGGGTSVSGGGGDDSDDSLPIDGDGGDAAEAITGRVCMYSPLRASFRGNCSDDMVAATVEIDGRTTAPLANGNFAIALESPIDPDAPFRVTGPDIMPTVMLQTATNQILAVRALAYNDELTLYGQLAPEQEQGVIVVQIVDDGVPVVGAAVSSDRQMDLGTLYDDDVEPLFAPTILTGAEGLAWISQTGVGANTVLVTPPGSAPQVTVVLPVESRAITFHRIELP